MKRREITIRNQAYPVAKALAKRLMVIKEEIRERELLLAAELTAMFGGLMPMQLNIIRFIGNNRRVTMSEIALTANITLGSVTQAIDVLVAKKILRRTKAEYDRRVVCAELAPRGREIYLMIKKRLTSAAENFLSKFPPAEQERALSYIIKLKDEK